MAKLFDAFEAPENDPGRWFPLERALKPGEDYDPDDKENKGVPAVLVRSIPDDVDTKLTRHHLGNKLQYRTRGRDQVLTLDRRKGPALQADRAVYAMLDTRNCEIGAGDEGFAKQLSEAVGATVTVGQSVLMDGHWTEPTKRYLFKRSAKFLQKVLDAAGVLDFELQEDEEGKDEG